MASRRARWLLPVTVPWAVALALILLWPPSEKAADAPFRVVYCDPARAMPFLIAQQTGLFDEAGVRVRLYLTAPPGLSAGDHQWKDLLARMADDRYDLFAGCPAGLVRRAVSDSPAKWAWSGEGYETRDGAPLSAVLAARASGITDLEELERAMADGSLKIAVPDDLWVEEAGLLWPGTPKDELRIMQPFRADTLLDREVQAVFGDMTRLRPLARDPRLVLVAVNPRVAGKEHHWDCASLIRRETVAARRTEIDALLGALDRAKDLWSSYSIEECEAIQAKIGLPREKLAVPAYLSREELKTATAAPPGGGATATASDRRPEQPPFSPPKSKDVEKAPE